MIQPRAIPKFHRLKLSGVLRTLLLALPIKKFKEIRGGSHIYLGQGLMKWGSRYRKSQILVTIPKGKITIRLDMKDGSIVLPFHSTKERETSTQKILECLSKNWTLRK